MWTISALGHICALYQQILYPQVTSSLDDVQKSQKASYLQKREITVTSRAEGKKRSLRQLGWFVSPIIEYPLNEIFSFSFHSSSFSLSKKNCLKAERMLFRLYTNRIVNLIHIAFYNDIIFLEILCFFITIFLFINAVYCKKVISAPNHGILSFHTFTAKTYHSPAVRMTNFFLLIIQLHYYDSGSLVKTDWEIC